MTTNQRSASQVKVIVDALSDAASGKARRSAGWGLELVLLAGILLLAHLLSTLSFRGEIWFDPQLSLGQKWQQSIEKGILWDDGGLHHPDERFVVNLLAPRLKLPDSGVPSVPGQKANKADGTPVQPQETGKRPVLPTAGSYFDPLTSPLNPYLAGHEHDYAYGQLPLTFLVWLNEGVVKEKSPEHKENTPEYKVKSPEQQIQMGLHPRQLVGYANLLTIFAVWWMVRVWRGRWPALLAALLAAVSPMLLEHARYFVVDPFMAAFAALAVAGLVCALDKPRWLPILFAAVCTGLAVACKVTALFLLLPWLLWAVRWAVFEPRPIRRIPLAGVKPAGRGRTWRFLGQAVLAAVLAFSSFRVASPYTFGGPVKLSALFAWSVPDQPEYALPAEPSVDDLHQAQSALPARVGKLEPGEHTFLPVVSAEKYRELYAEHPTFVRRLFAAGLWPNDLWTQAMRKRTQEQREFTGLPYFYHCFGRWPVVYSLSNLAQYALGWGVFLFAGLGVVLALTRLAKPVRQWDWAGLIFAATSLFTLAYIGLGFAQITRYYLGITPFLIALSAGAMTWLTGWCRAQARGQITSPDQEGGGVASATECRAASPDGLISRDAQRSENTSLALGVASRLTNAGLVKPVATRPITVHLAYFLLWLPRIAVVYSVFYGLALMNIFAAPSTRVQASEWLYKNLPPHRTIVHEVWDDGLPGYFPGHNPGEYQYADLSLYDNDTPDKRDRIIETLQRADCIVLASDRIYGALPQRPDLFPMSANYYRQLLSGQLGFHVERVFKQPPTLLGLTFPDELAEHTWQIYTRPTVVVLLKDQDRSLTFEELEDKLPLKPAKVPTDVEIERLIPDDPVGMSTPEVSFYPNNVLRTSWSVLNSRPVGLALVWWLFLLGLAWMTWPAYWPMLREWPDAGWGLCRTLAIVFPALLAWWIGSVTGLGWNLLTVLSAMGVFIGVMLWLGSRSTFAWQAWTSQPRIGWLVVESLCLLFFAIFVAVRVCNPGAEMSFGEKAGELTCLSQYLQGCSLPLVYPWFAGEQSTYYNFGWMTWSVPGMLWGFSPGVTFNLAMASLPVLSAGAFFSLAGRLTKSWCWGLLGTIVAVVGGNWWWLWRAFNYPKHDWSEVRELVLLYAIPAVAAALLTGLTALLGKTSGRGVSSKACWTAAVCGILLGAAAATWALPHTLAGERVQSYLLAGKPAGAPFDANAWYSRLWDSTRVTPDKVTAAIQEYPQFTFLFGDLHGHAMGMPLLLTLWALGLWLVERRSGRLPMILTAGLLFGALIATNVWDAVVAPVGLLAILVGGWFSLYAGLPHAAWWKRAWRMVRGSGLGRLLTRVALPLLAIIVLGLLAAGPFTLDLLTARSGEGNVRPIPGPWADYTDWVQLFGPHLLAGLLALFVLIFAARGQRRWVKVPVALGLMVCVWAACLWIVPQFYRPHLVKQIITKAEEKAEKDKKAYGQQLPPVLVEIKEGKANRLTTESYALRCAVDNKDYPSVLALAMRPGATEKEVKEHLEPAGCGPVGDSHLPSTATVALAMLLTVLLGTVFMPDRRAMIALLLFAAGLGLAVLIEWVEVMERMNSIFKFGLGEWWLLVLGAVGLLAALTRGLSVKFTAGKASQSAGAFRWAVVVGVVGIALAGWELSLAPFSNHALAIARRLGRAQPDLYTLDATRFLALTEPDEAAIVNWLRSKNNPRLVLAEAANGYYTRHGRIGTYSGTQTLLGWGWHSQRHGVDASKVNERARLIQNLYQSDDRQQRALMLDRLRPDYVIVGELEYQAFGEKVRERIETTPGVREVFRAGIYRVYSFSPAELYSDRLREALMP